MSHPLPSAADLSRSVDGQPSSDKTVGESWPDTDHDALTKLRAGSAAEREEALRQLFAAYIQPLRRYIRHHWPLLQETEIDDLTSEFATLCLTGDKAHFLTYDAGRAGAPVRLRTYLRTILDNFLRNHRRRARARVRGGDRLFESLDTIRPAPHQEASAEDITPPPGVNVEAYDRHWAQHIISVAFRTLESGTPATRDWLLVLRPWILADPGDATLREIARDSGRTHAAVRTQLHRLRKSWRQAVRDAVSRTVSHPDDIDDELRHLAAVLSRHPVE